jgi:hypothetical protein
VRVWVLLLAMVVFGSWQWATSRPLDPGPGAVAPNVPVQRTVMNPKPFSHNGYSITPLAEFELEARVLGTESYWFGRESDLSPVDLALGWGPMSDGEVLKAIDIRQSNRFYYWSTSTFPIARAEIERNSANMHIVPADKWVARQLSDVREGNVVRLRGYLVQADANDGWSWRSSVRREDTGAGACELVWVEDLSFH